MNIFGFRPFKGKFNLGNSDDIPTNNDGTLIGAIKQINTHLTASNDAPFRFDYDSNSDKYGYVINEGGADTFFPFSGSANGTLVIVGTLYGSAWNSGGTPQSGPYNPNDPGTNTTISTVTITIKVTDGVATTRSITGNTPANYHHYYSSYNWVSGKCSFTITSVSWTPD